MFQLPSNLPDECYASSRINKTEKKWKTYIKLNRKYIHQTVEYQKQYDNKELKFPISKARKQCGKFHIDGKQIYAWDVFFKAMPFFNIVKVGNGITKQMTQIQLQNKLVKKLLDFTDADKEDMYYWLDDKELVSLPYIHVDVNSLGNYIFTTENNLKDPRTDEDTKNKLRERYNYALSIIEYMAYCSENGGMCDAIPYIAETGLFGRTYHKGLNLISAPREVRHAALGKCWEYDIQNSVLAFKLSIVKDILGDDEFYGKFTYSKQYMEEKEFVRNSLVSTLKMSYKNQQGKEHIANYTAMHKRNVKEAMTAIMFGASVTDKAWYDGNGKLQHGALSNIIKNPNAREDFIKKPLGGTENGKPFILSFVEEQKELDKIILENVGNDAIKDVIKRIPELDDRLTTRSGRVNKKATLVFLYQQFEKKLMSAVKKYCSDDVILHVHDAIYLKREVNIKKLNDIAQEFGEFIKFDVTELRGSFKGGYNSITANHKAHIAQEQQDAVSAAQTLNNVFAMPTSKPNFERSPDQLVKSSIKQQKDAAERKRIYGGM